MASIKPELDQVYDLLTDIRLSLPNNILAKRDTIVDLLANCTLLTSLKYPEQIKYLSKITARHLSHLHSDRRQVALASVLLMSSFIDQTRLGMNYNIDRLPKPVGTSTARSSETPRSHRCQARKERHRRRIRRRTRAGGEQRNGQPHPHRRIPHPSGTRQKQAAGVHQILGRRQILRRPPRMGDAGRLRLRRQRRGRHGNHRPPDAL